MGLRALVITYALQLAACSQVIDTSEVQCRTDSECGSIGDAAPYQCLEGFCRALACASDADCRPRGSFICEQQRCGPAACLRAEDCADAGETCMAGRCADPVFGCFHEPAALAGEQPAALELSLLGYVDKRPIRLRELRVCALGDTPCNTPLAVASSYDPATGNLTISKLENGARYSIRVFGAGADGTPLIETEYYMVRPVLGRTKVEQRLELVSEPLVDAIAGTAGTTWNPAQGLVFATIFGCDRRPLAGVSLLDNRAAVPYYFTGTASLDTAETDAQGQAGFVNMEVGSGGAPLLHKLTVVYRGQNLFSVSVAPRPRVLTVLDLEMTDYGTTVDRASAVAR